MKNLKIEDVIQILLDSGATDSANVVNKMSKKNKEKILKKINNFENSHIVSFIIKSIEETNKSNEK